MKRLTISILLFTLTFSSCSDRDDSSGCECLSQRYERSAERSTANGSLLSSSEWVKIDDPIAAPEDCTLNGQTLGFGSYNSYLIDGSRYGVQEYENRVTCK